MKLRESALGVFGDNRRLPIHRWYPFIEGYSSELVAMALDEARDASVVFDPFGGSGTTSLTAALRGSSSFFTEANPYMAWLADVKVNGTRRAVGSGADCERLIAFAAQVERVRVPTVSSEHPLVIASDRRDYFPPGVASEIVGLISEVGERFDQPLRELALVAVAAAITPSSNMLRRTDLRRRTTKDARPADFRAEVAKNLQMVARDVALAGADVRGWAVQIGDDAKFGWSVDEPITAIVTSPPYLNGTNYGRNTKLELLALGFIDGEAGLEGLRTREITAGINNVAKRNAEPIEFPAVEEVAQRVSNASYDRRIASMVRAYFSDMYHVLRRTASYSAPHAELWLDIGDSRYAGVAVPTHTLLAGVAELSGWCQVDERLLRTRRSYDGSALSQSLLKFRRRDVDGSTGYGL
ncbi:hypothetical protein [Microbacterium aurantiacum]|uniref:hypothetical protein n=1 Tax=Microbacterium aurantiacum TaxID=162393 RepID=UPI003427F834